MPPRRRISSIAKLLPRKRASAPDQTPVSSIPVKRDYASLPAGLNALDEGTILQTDKLLPRKRASAPDTALPPTIPVKRDCASLPAGLGTHDEGATLHAEEPSFAAFHTSETFADDVSEGVSTLDPRDLRVHRFAQRYESNQLPSYRDYPPVEEDERAPLQGSTNSHLIHASELQQMPEAGHSHSPEPEHGCSHCCDLSSLQHELSLLRENHKLLSDTTRETLRLTEALEARVETLQRGARPSEALFWMLLDSLAAVVLFLFRLLMKPWLMTRRWFVAERVRKRRSWRLSVGDFENDPFLSDVAKRLSFSAAED